MKKFLPLIFVVLITIILVLNSGIVLSYTLLDDRTSITGNIKYYIFFSILLLVTDLVIVTFILIRYYVRSSRESGQPCFNENHDIPIPGGMSSLWDEEKAIIVSSEVDEDARIAKKNDQVVKVIQMFYQMYADQQKTSSQVDEKSAIVQDEEVATTSCNATGDADSSKVKIN